MPNEGEICVAMRQGPDTGGAPKLIRCTNKATKELYTKYFSWTEPVCDECYEQLKDKPYIKP